MKDKHGARAGTYKRSSDVNGRPSYRNDEFAIWYEENKWIIGKLEHLGSNTGSIFTEDNFGGLIDKKNLWKYLGISYYGTIWNKATTNDFTIECTSGTL